MASRQDDTWILDLSDEAVKCRLITEITKREGIHEVMVHKKRISTSDPQRAYYWAVVIEWFRRGARAEWGEDPGADEAHAMLKYEHLRVEPERNQSTGEIVGRPYIRSIMDLEWDEMGEYLEGCCNTIKEYFGLDVPPPDPYWKLNGGAYARTTD